LQKWAYAVAILFHRPTYLYAWPPYIMQFCRAISNNSVLCVCQFALSPSVEELNS